MHEGILLVDKPQGISSFRVVSILRRRLGIKRIGHGGTLDPMATGVMILFVGRTYTKQADLFLTQEKEYEATFCLGKATDTYDRTGVITHTSEKQPSYEEVAQAIEFFQGEQQQTPPLYSAKKIGGRRLYEFARKGVDVPRPASTVHMRIVLIEYTYPKLILRIVCSKGTYIRSLAHDLGQKLGSYAHVEELRRTRSGSYRIQECITSEQLLDHNFSLVEFLKK
jgi:tRNA pseudouridine55 synthase